MAPRDRVIQGVGAQDRGQPHRLPHHAGYGIALSADGSDARQDQAEEANRRQPRRNVSTTGCRQRADGGTKQLSIVPNDDRHITFQALLDNDGIYRSYPIADLTDAIAVLQYTGGTTGLPKGAMLTHANLTAATSQCIETTRTDPPTLDEGKERVLAVLPPFHIYAITVNMLLGIHIGAELVLHTRFDVDAVVKDLTEKKITAFPGVPTMFVAVLHHPGAANADLSSLKWCNSGGAPLPLEVQQSFEKLTGCRLLGTTTRSPTT